MSRVRFRRARYVTPCRPHRPRTEFFGRDVEQGSYSALYAALSPEVIEKGYNGYYLSDPGTPGKETFQGSDKWLAAGCWELSERLVKMKLGEDAMTSWSA